jgi:hypothetical protein
MHYVILALPLPLSLLPRCCRILLVASSRSVVAVLHPFVFVFVDILFSSRAPLTPHHVALPPHQQDPRHARSNILTPFPKVRN